MLRSIYKKLCCCCLDYVYYQINYNIDKEKCHEMIIKGIKHPSSQKEELKGSKIIVCQTQEYRMCNQATCEDDIENYIKIFNSSHQYNNIVSCPITTRISSDDIDIREILYEIGYVYIDHIKKDEKIYEQYLLCTKEEILQREYRTEWCNKICKDINKKIYQKYKEEQKIKFKGQSKHYNVRTIYHEKSNKIELLINLDESYKEEIEQLICELNCPYEVFISFKSSEEQDSEDLKAFSTLTEF